MSFRSVLCSVVAKRLALIALLLAMLTLHFSSSLLPTLDKLGRQTLMETNERYLEEAGEEALALFSLLSALKSGLAVIESSSTGISFLVEVELQVGSFLSSLSETIDYGWRGSLVGLAAIETMRLLLVCNETLLPFAIQLFLVLLLLHQSIRLFVSAAPSFLRKGVWLSALFTLVTLLLLPLALLFAQGTSKAITQPLHKEVHKQLQERHAHLLFHKKEGTMESVAKAGANSYKKATTDQEEKQRHLTQQITRHLTALLFDALLFPCTFLYLASVALRRLHRQQFRLTFSSGAYPLSLRVSQLAR